jgi:regulator of cell morphogenesis and NO signaling
MPISVMEQEHEHAGNLLASLRALTGAYQSPDWACNTFRGLYAGLEELERDLHVHIHLENNILFPRAAELEQQF